MAQEQKQPKKASETEEAPEVAPDAAVAERKEQLDEDIDAILESEARSYPCALSSSRCNARFVSRHPSGVGDAARSRPGPPRGLPPA